LDKDHDSGLGALGKEIVIHAVGIAAAVIALLVVRIFFFSLF
jgi:hypothetical protein